MHSDEQDSSNKNNPMVCLHASLTNLLISSSNFVYLIYIEIQIVIIML